MNLPRRTPLLWTLLVALLASAAQGDEGPPAKTAADPIVITGRVVNQQEQPVEGAMLCLTLRYSYFGEEPLDAVAESDADGRFKLSVPGEWLKQEQDYRLRTLWCFKPGQQLGMASAAEQIDDRSDAPVEIKLGPPSDVAFRVQGPDGQPAAGVSVRRFWYLADAYTPTPAAIVTALAAQTDEDGLLSLPWCDAKKLHSLHLASGDHGEQSFTVNDAPGDRPPLTLREAGGLRLSFQSDEGPASGMRVSASSHDRSNQTGSGIGVGVTDENGVVEFERLAVGRYMVRAQLEPGVKLLPKMPDLVTISQDETTDLDIPMTPGVKVTGSVVAEGADRPVVGARVQVGYGNGQSQRAETDANGRFVVYAQAGRAYAYASRFPKPFDKWLIDNSRRAVAQIDEGATEATMPPIYLQQGTLLAGRLVDEEGEPLAGRRVSMRAGGLYLGQARTNPEGRFEVSIAAGKGVTEYRIGSPNNGARDQYARVRSEDPLVLAVRRNGLPWNVEVAVSPTPPAKLAAPPREDGGDDSDQPSIVFAKNVVIVGGKAGDFVDAQEYLESFDRPDETSPRFAVTQGRARESDGYEEVRLWTQAMRQLIGFSGGGVNIVGTQISGVYDALELGDSWPPDDAETVTGQVLTPDGKPAAGAEVLLLFAPANAERHFSAHIYLKNGALRDTREQIVAYADAEGRFEHLIPTPQQYGFIVLHRSGFGVWQRGESTEPQPTVQLEPWARIVTTLPGGEAMEPSTSIGPNLRDFAGIPYVSFSEFGKNGELQSEYPAVPPLGRVNVQRNYHHDGMGFPASPSTLTLDLKPGTTTHITYGPLTEEDKRDIQQTLDRHRGR